MRKPKLRMKYTLTVGLARVDEMEDIIQAWKLDVLNRVLLDTKPGVRTNKGNGRTRERAAYTKTYKTIPDDVLISIYGMHGRSKTRGAMTEVAERYGIGRSTVGKIWGLAEQRYIDVLYNHKAITQNQHRKATTRLGKGL